MSLYREKKIRKYGFHGTSHKYVAERCAALMGKPIEELKIITCHLGSGSSICAVKNGKSVDTTMGFTPLDGCIMGTRCGSIDPAVVTFIMDQYNMTTAEVNDLMNPEVRYLRYYRRTEQRFPAILSFYTTRRTRRQCLHSIWHTM